VATIHTIISDRYGDEDTNWRFGAPDQAEPPKEDLRQLEQETNAFMAALGSV